ncbi:hypothetical protein OG21DRAFT_1227633 [Imleria badia]|nr:hypothetical protein OG21DRAFT_1227633 [Imleria badia]
MLDAELGKVATFYAEREKEMHERAKLLRKQLNELGVHRRMVYESPMRSKLQSWAKRAYLSVPLPLSSLVNWSSDPNTKPKEPHQSGGNRILAAELGRGGHHGKRDEVAKGAAKKGPGTTSFPRALDEFSRLPPKRLDVLPSVSSGGTNYSLDPHAYGQVKNQLREAVAEHYRGLEILNNYRILNLTGFRKALRKYGKITKTSVVDAYMKDKVEPSAFASGAIVSIMLKEMVHLFAMRFEHGNRKKAKDHLRVEPLSKPQHDFSTFGFGFSFWLGLALPAIAAGSYLCRSLF